MYIYIYIYIYIFVPLGAAQKELGDALLRLGGHWSDTYSCSCSYGYDSCSYSYSMYSYSYSSYSYSL